MSQSQIRADQIIIIARWGGGDYLWGGCVYLVTQIDAEETDMLKVPVPGGMLCREVAEDTIKGLFGVDCKACPVFLSNPDADDSDPEYHHISDSFSFEPKPPCVIGDEGVPTAIYAVQIEGTPRLSYVPPGLVGLMWRNEDTYEDLSDFVEKYGLEYDSFWDALDRAWDRIGARPY